ncbi:unnamed protein product, partial [Ectocarpus sp. 8 AP-2014]
GDGDWSRGWEKQLACVTRILTASQPWGLVDQAV